MSKSTKLSDLANQAISTKTISATLAAALMTFVSSGAFAQHAATSASSDNKASTKVNKEVFAKSRVANSSATKTERAKQFDSTVKSEEYWKKLYASMAKHKPVVLPKKKSRKPALVIGSN